MPPTPRYKGHYTPRHPWSPMTDAEWHALRPYVTAPANHGGRPADHRARWDAVFWIACSKHPWRELPDSLGKPNSAERALRRARDDGTLEDILRALSPNPRRRNPALATLAYRLLRAFRRVSRRMSIALIVLAKDLGLWTALPCYPVQLPDLGLSEIIESEAPKLLNPATRTPQLMAFLTAIHRLLKPDLRGWRIA